MSTTQEHQSLDITARVYAENVPALADQEAPCMWFARCTNPANGLRVGPVGNGEFGMIPICKRCDDKMEGLTK